MSAYTQATPIRSTEITDLLPDQRPMNQPFVPENIRDELLYLRAVTAYHWALPLLSIRSMKEASEAKFGAGYNVLPIYKRLRASTVVTTPNSDVIYAMGYLDLREGAMVIDAPPGLQGIIDDFFQRPIEMVGQFEGRDWSGDVGLPGPDKGEGGKYLILPPDYQGEVPDGYFVYQCRTYGVFVFWRGFYSDPNELDAPTKVLEETKIYPLGQESTARSMVFPDATFEPNDLLFPYDSRAFDVIKRAIDQEYVDERDMDMRGLLAAIGIVKDEPFEPNVDEREILDAAAERAILMARWGFFEEQANRPGGKLYEDRQWTNLFPPHPGTADWTTPTYTHIDQRSIFFSACYSASPGMALNMVGKGAKYPGAFKDADGVQLNGSKQYKLHLPADIPARLFWSVTMYDVYTASGLQNGQPIPSINLMDEPIFNEDGSIDFYFGPEDPGEGKNWLASVPGKPFFVGFRLFGPEQAYFDQSWKPDDVVKVG